MMVGEGEKGKLPTTNYSHLLWSSKKDGDDGMMMMMM